MIKKLSFNSNLSKFLWKIALNKQYMKILKSKILLLLSEKRKIICKYLSLNLFFRKLSYWVTSIVEIFFSQTNTLLSIFDFSGKLRFFCSAGDLFLKGKHKKFRHLVFKSIKKLLMWKFKSSYVGSTALHLKNVRHMKYRITWNLTKKLFIQVVKNFTIYPCNGCRKKKIRRKK